MQAVILAAGLGTRMGELTKNTPKPLLKIQDRTLLEHNLTAMPDEIDEVVLVVGYLEEQIRTFIGNEFLGKKIIYVQQKDLKGTAHALSMCKGRLHGRFLVIMGDDLYYKKDLEALVKKSLAILIWEMRDDALKDGRNGLIKTDDYGQVIDIVERQPAQRGVMVNTGAYVLDETFFDYPLVSAGIPATEYGLPQTFLQMVKKGAKVSVVKAQWWHKVGSPNDLTNHSQVSI
jgi:NDP-sugar pyrophosphorylase family protein